MPVIAPSRELLQFCIRVTDVLRRAPFYVRLLQFDGAPASKDYCKDVFGRPSTRLRIQQQLLNWSFVPDIPGESPGDGADLPCVENPHDEMITGNAAFDGSRTGTGHRVGMRVTPRPVAGTEQRYATQIGSPGRTDLTRKSTIAGVTPLKATTVPLSHFSFPICHLPDCK